MSDIKKYNIGIETISPVHIGSGEDYTACEFIRDKLPGKNGDIDVYKRINLSKYYSSLSEDKKDDLINSLSTPNFELNSFDSKISNKFKVYTSYNRCKVDVPANREIEENIKTLNEIYIPGSSIKGAIKTAILFNTISYEDIRKIDDLFYRNRRGELRVGDDDRILDNIFTNPRFRNKAQGSIMRFLQVADSSTIKYPAVYDVVSIMATENGSKQYYRRNGNVIRSFLECIGSEMKLQTTITTNYNERTYGTLNLGDKKDLINIDFIKKSIYDFSSALIEHEIEFSKKYEIAFLTNFYKKYQKYNTPDSPLLKIGSGSGLLATTFGLKIKEYDESEFDDYFDRVRLASSGRNYEFEYPKSRKITVKGAKPLGWVKLTFN